MTDIRFQLICLCASILALVFEIYLVFGQNICDWFRDRYGSKEAGSFYFGHIEARLKEKDLEK